MVTFTHIALLLYLLIDQSLADCECGYTAHIGNSTEPYLFTDLVESDFLHLSNISLNTDWRRQNFSVSATQARGPFGMNFTIDTVLSNPLDTKNRTYFDGPSRFGGDPGIALAVEGGFPSDGHVKTSELDSARVDMFYGSYRARMKMSAIKGTCAAFFWVR